MPRERRLERETGIEPATNSLEGCDSTTELLPPFDWLRSLRASLRALYFRYRLNAAARQRGGQKQIQEGRVRTSVARRRQVYSLLRLTALPPPRYVFQFVRVWSPCVGAS